MQSPRRRSALLALAAPVGIALGLVAGIVTAAMPATAQACACCAEPGMRMEGPHPMDEYVRGELSRMRFAERAELPVGPAGLEEIRGITDPADTYTLDASVDTTREGSAITLTFLGEDGRQGTITVPLGDQIHEFFVDTRTGSRDEETGLYKEWTLKGRAKTTGIFARASKSGRPRVRLIFHGGGNACTDAAQFGHWTLEVRGTTADFTLMGEMAPSDA